MLGRRNYARDDETDLYIYIMSVCELLGALISRLSFRIIWMHISGVLEWLRCNDDDANRIDTYDETFGLQRLTWIR